METYVTIIIGETEVPKIKNSKNPWLHPPEITEEMEMLVEEIIDPAKTKSLIEEVEGGF